MENEPPYLYVRGNPVNRVDPDGLRPIRSGGCDGEKPCTVIVGAKKIGDVGEGPSFNTHFYHAFLLVADPNRIFRPEIFGLKLPNVLGAMPPSAPPVFVDTTTNHRGKPLEDHIKEPSTVYFFRGGPRGNPFTAPLVGKYGIYRAGSTLDYLPLSGVYKTLADDISCPYILGCFKKVMDHVTGLREDYDGGPQRNSNSVVSSALRRCGLNANNPFPDDMVLPQWDEDIDDNNWGWWWGPEEHSNEDWPDTYPRVPPRPDTPNDPNFPTGP